MIVINVLRFNLNESEPVLINVRKNIYYFINILSNEYKINLIEFNKYIEILNKFNIINNNNAIIVDLLEKINKCSAGFSILAFLNNIWKNKYKNGSKFNELTSSKISILKNLIKIAILCSITFFYENNYVYINAITTHQIIESYNNNIKPENNISGENIVPPKNIVHQKNIVPPKNIHKHRRFKWPWEWEFKFGKK
jgi:hypothetical protein